MSNTQLLDLGLAIALPVGGAIGYARRQSLPSLITGGAFGIVFGLAAYLIEEDPNSGYGLGLLAASILAVVGFFRLRKTRKFMPAGMLVTVGLGAAILNGANIA